MPTFGDLSSELAGRLPGLSPFLAQIFINRAWSSICGARRWSFLIFDGAVNCPALVSAGAFNITQFGLTVTANAAASAALAAITGVNVTSLQIRFMGLGQTSQIYNITNYNVSVPTAAVLTLDRAVQEPTNAASQYMVYRAYIVPPIADFIQFESLNDMVNGINIGGAKLSFSSSYFDIRDPQRQAFGLSYYLGHYRAAASTNVVSTDSAPMYELWPGSTQGQNFYVRFRRRGTTPAATDQLPTQIHDEMILAKAFEEGAYPHMQANVGFFPNFAKADFRGLILEAGKQYRDELTKAKRLDDEQALQTVFNRGHGLRQSRFGGVGFPYPIDSNFFQSHAVFWLGLFAILGTLCASV